MSPNVPKDTIASEDIDGRVYELYDEYCHGHIDRREFLRAAAARSPSRASRDRSWRRR